MGSKINKKLVENCSIRELEKALREKKRQPLQEPHVDASASRALCVQKSQQHMTDDVTMQQDNNEEEGMGQYRPHMKSIPHQSSPPFESKGLQADTARARKLQAMASRITKPTDSYGKVQSHLMMEALHLSREQWKEMLAFARDVYVRSGCEQGARLPLLKKKAEYEMVCEALEIKFPALAQCCNSWGSKYLIQNYHRNRCNAESPSRVARQESFSEHHGQDGPCKRRMDANDDTEDLPTRKTPRCDRSPSNLVDRSTVMQRHTPQESTRTLSSLKRPPKQSCLPQEGDTQEESNTQDASGTEGEADMTSWTRSDADADSESDSESQFTPALDEPWPKSKAARGVSIVHNTERESAPEHDSLAPSQRYPIATSSPMPSPIQSATSPTSPVEQARVTLSEYSPSNNNGKPCVNSVDGERNHSWTALVFRNARSALNLW